MTTGLDCRDSYLYGWHGLREMRSQDDWVQYVLDLPMVAEPGTSFEYCNGASYLLSAIVQESTGMTALEYAQENLFGPLGITDLAWPSSPQGISIGWGELWMKPQDLAKIGYLYLQDGRWAGRQVVPSDWVVASTAKRTDATLQGGYGYQWWIDDSGRYYMALGYAGQFVFVLPELDMVVVFVSDLADRDFYVPQELLTEYILRAVRPHTSLPANPCGMEMLQAEVEALKKRNSPAWRLLATRSVWQLRTQCSTVMRSVDMRVTEDGFGFDPTVTTDRGGLRLCDIEERAAKLGGGLTVRSRPGQGTKSSIEVRQ
jgi:CubicO group peptidase (beta-lactamase class C family)